jgi:transposase
MAMTIVEAARGVTGGVDTHLDVHVAAALDPIGGLFGTAAFPTTATGYEELLGWLRSFGEVRKVGVEGTGSYGAGLSRYLRTAGVSVIDVNRPNREERRRSGKSDPLDAIEAARAALGGKAKSIAKSKDGAVEGIRALLVAKRSARVARTAALVQMRQLVVTAPDQLRDRLRGLTVHALTTEAARLRPADRGDPVVAATKATLGLLARRVHRLDDELAELDTRIEVLLVERCPDLLSRFGVGPDTAAALVVCSGDNPERLHSEPAWAHLCGVAPIPAGSGQTSGRVRVDYAGDRQANAALWRIVMVRIAHHPETTAYFTRKLQEGRPKQEIIRLLKRYVAREVYRYLPRG